MKKNKIILVVTDDELVKNYSESNITFLFPLEEFSIGFPKTFKITEINKGFILVNRILDNAGITKFREVITKNPHIEGIIFDDLGVLNVLNDLKLDMQKILFLNHFNCNYESINIYLNYVDSVVVSSDITEEELDEILAKTTKDLVVFTFGHVNIMYSRRTLLTNYNKYFQKNVVSLSNLEDEISKNKFKIFESVYGTVIYTAQPFNGLRYRNKKHVLYNMINPIFLTNDEIKKILTSSDNLEDTYPYQYLSTKKTIYKLKERE